MGIDSSSIISSSAKIHSSVDIGPFCIIGDDVEGNRLIQEFYVTSGKAVRKTSRDLLLTTGLAQGEVKN